MNPIRRYNCIEQEGSKLLRDCINKSRYSLTVRLATGPKPLPKRVFHIVRSKVSSFSFQYFLVSLRSSNSCLRLPSPHFVPFIFSSKTCLRRQLPRKMWPTHFPLLYVVHSFPLGLYVVLHFSHNRFNWFSLSHSSTRFKTFQGISDLFSEMFNFQHHRIMLKT